MIVIDWPEAMTAENWKELAMPGQVTVWRREPPIFYLTWVYMDVAVELLLDAELRTVTLDEATDAERVALLEALLAKLGQPPGWLAMYEQIRDVAASAAGVRVDQLTAAQRNALVAVLLWDRKAIADDGRIRPLRQWVRRRPAE